MEESPDLLPFLHESGLSFRSPEMGQREKHKTSHGMPCFCLGSVQLTQLACPGPAAKSRRFTGLGGMRWELCWSWDASCLAMESCPSAWSSFGISWVLRRPRKGVSRGEGVNSVSHQLGLCICLILNAAQSPLTIPLLALVFHQPLSH